MTKDNKCSSKKSCASSENSEVCYKVRCEPACKKPCCDIKKCPGYCPEELLCRYQDAVVEIQSEFILLGTGAVGATAGTPLSPNGRADVIVEGNGFFMKGHYIVAPAHLVLLPPSLTSVANRYPFLDPNDLSLGQIKNQMVRASRILVSVFNVNGKGSSFVYEADLVGVDGAGNVALLKINFKKQWNACNPCVEKCHPYFTFGQSRASKDGEKVYLIGDPISNPNNRRLFNAVGAISEGLLQDHRHLEYSGFALHESILVSAPVYAFSAGLPILNAQGQVIGMQTTDVASVLPRLDVTATVGGANQLEGLGAVGGPSEFFIRRVIKAFLKGTCSRKPSRNLETIFDPVGAYYRYKKAYAGLAYDVFTGVDYDVTVDYTSGLPPLGQPRVRLDSFGNFLGSPVCKELVGIRVLGLAGANPDDALGVANGYWYVPGGTGTAPLVDFATVSPLLGKLTPGDVITHINDVALGDLNCQIAPSLILWRLCAGAQLEITYRRGGNALNDSPNDATENYESCYSTTIGLGEFPLVMDYPWYAVNYFPLLAELPYPGFVFPGGQSQNPQVPSLAAGAPFHPAL